jgi:glutamyl-tRNA synthetase
MLRVRFAPSPTGFLHVGSARTFIFNWLYARRNGGTMVLRLDDTDVERNTDASVNSIFEGLRWLDLGWDEEYKQSERLALHRQIADAIFQKGLAYRDFTPAHIGDSEKSGANQTWLFNPGMREAFPRRERPPSGGRRVLRAPLPRSPRARASKSASMTRSTASKSSPRTTSKTSRCCVPTACPPITLPRAPTTSICASATLSAARTIFRTPTSTCSFSKALARSRRSSRIFPAGRPRRIEALQAPHGPVVSVTTYRDAGFLPEAFINFLCLLGWSPKDDRENMTRQELTEAFSLEGINRANAVINFKEPAATPDETFDPKALWLNAEHIRGFRSTT